MKNTLKIAALSLLCLVIVGGLVFKAARADTTNTVLSNLITPSSDEDSTTLEQRLAARRPKVQLSAADKASIAAKCSLAQTAINDRRTKDTKAAAIRLQNYFVASINSYLTDAGKYKTAMDDLVIMDCKSDPAGFKASLTEARQLRTQLNTDVSNIKKNLANLQKSLANARQALIKNPKGSKN
jgi:hypothetical protein